MEPERWDNTRFATFVRAELRRREWLQADFARKVGVPNGTLARWLNGKRRPTPESALRIADALNADPDAILAMVGHREETEPTDPDTLFGRLVALLKRIDLEDGRRGYGLEKMLRDWAEDDRKAGSSRAPGASS